MCTKQNRLDLSSVCRLCVGKLSQDEFESLFNDHEGQKLRNKIYIFSSLEMNAGDGLPKNVCYPCISKLKHCFDFRNQCIEADRTLRNSICISVETLESITESSHDNQLNKPSSVKELEQINATSGKEEINAETEKKIVVSVNEEEKTDENIVKQRPPLKRVRLRKLSENLKNGTSLEPIYVYQDLSTTQQKGSNKKRRRNEKTGTTVLRQVLNRKNKSRSNGKKKPASFTCEFCKKEYPSEGGWRYHLHVVHSQSYQPFICELCGKSFKVKKNLEVHRNSIHLQLKQHLCDLCGRGFATKYALQVHKIWHTGERNYTCDVCNAKFRIKGKLNSHRAVHGGPKNFICEVCSRDFRWKKDLEIHMRTHTGEKPYSCSVCGKTFSSLTNMKKHERNHGDRTQRVTTSSEAAVVADVPDISVPVQDFKTELCTFSIAYANLEAFH